MKNVLITGSTRGIGAQIALDLSQTYCVILHGRNKTDQSELFEKLISKKSLNTRTYYFDVGNTDETEKATKTMLKEYGSIDILINNAGIVKDRTLTKMSYEEWDMVLKTNLYGPFNVTRYILPSMIAKGWGRIINMSSVIGQKGNFGQTNYSASKAGLVGFTKSLAIETAKHNITVNAVCPGFVDTEILKAIPQDFMNKIISSIPIKRLASKKEIAGLVRYLASDESGYITGATLNINGGLY